MRFLRPVSLIVLLFVVSIVPAYRAGESLPVQLSDSSYWQLITNTSEPDGAFFSENFLSNERGFQYVIPALLQRVQPGGVYMGVGPEQNFTYISVLHPKLAFILDIRRQNMMEHLLYKALFELSPGRAEFLSRLFSRKLPANPAADTDVKDLFDAFAAVEQDETLYASNLQVVKDLLVKKHGFDLSADDLASLERVYHEFSRQGTLIGYSVSDAALMAQINTRARTGRNPNPVTATPIPANTEELYRLLVLNEPTVVQPLAAPPMAQSSFPNYGDLMTATDAEGHDWSYLSNEESYKSVREMQLQNRIVPLVGDFAGPKAIRAVGEYLKSHDAKLTAFYLSNVEQYLNPAELNRFYSSVATVPILPTSTFIRSVQGSGVQPGIAQSSISPMQEVIDAVTNGRIQTVNDIIRIWH